jgi:hypothetical protein
MTEYRGITGSFADFKLVKTRGVVQVITEIPIEEADQALESLGGIPVPGKERHVCIGLRDKLLEIAEGKATGPERHANLSLVGKQRYAEADEMEQARTRSALLAKDPQFIAWADTRVRAYDIADEVSAAIYIREEIGGSRSLIATDGDAYNRFLHLEREYLVWAGRAAEMRG